MVGAGLLGNALNACGVDNEATDTVKIGYLPITDATPLLIAHHRGLFTEEGLTSEKPTLIRGWSELSEAFMARTFNLTHLLLPITIFMRYSLKYPVKVIAWDHLNNSAITVHKNGGINTLADLGGRQIAVPYWYSMHNVVIQLAARTFGLEPVIQDPGKPVAANQVNLVVMKPPDMPTALGTGAIDGYIVAEPFNAAGELLADGKILRFTGDIWKNHPCCVAVLHEEAITQRKAWAQKVVNALVKAELWAHNNKEESAHILSKEGGGYLPLPEEVIRRAMLKYDLETYGPTGTGAIHHPEWEISRIGFQPYQFRDDTRRMVQLLKETRIKGDAEFLTTLSPDFVVEDLMDYQMVTAAIESVGGPTQFDGVGPNLPYERQATIEV
ncbi:MAG: ABC transporter substrate-binding protein [Anaerolineae bacterium]|nr:ABC transporter substrate-binding protein [Anaerolineae bacterium]